MRWFDNSYKYNYNLHVSHFWAVKSRKTELQYLSILCVSYFVAFKYTISADNIVVGQLSY
jgi:hypothetical protein